MTRDYDDAYARERSMLPPKDLRSRCRAVARLCVLDALNTDVITVASKLVEKAQSFLRGTCVCPGMLLNPVLMSNLDRLRTAVRENLINELLAKKILLRAYDSCIVPDVQSPIIILTTPTTHIPTTPPTLVRLSKITEIIEKTVDWDRLDSLLCAKMKALNPQVKQVAFGTKPSLNVWLNPVRSLNVVVRNYLDERGNEQDRFVCDVVEGVNFPHVRIEIARAVDSRHQYVAQFKIPIFVLLENGRVAYPSITVLRMGFVMGDDSEYQFLTDTKYRRMCFFHHKGINLPFFTFRCLMHRCLIPDLDANTTNDFPLSAVFFIFSYLYEENVKATHVEKLHHLDTFLSGGVPHPLFAELRTSIENAARILSVKTRNHFLRQFTFAFKSTLQSHMASHVMDSNRTIEFITPQSLEVKNIFLTRS